MCIVKTVGRNGANQRSDVKVVQALLNMNLGKLTPLALLETDGAIGEKTITAIREFQLRVVGLPRPTELIEPGSETLARLKAGMPGELTAEKLQAIMPAADEAILRRYFRSLAERMKANNIDTPLRMAHFLAQIGHESGDLRFAEELADGSQYEGRVDLGNTQAGDGPRFKGRGLIQLTGRSNYLAYGKFRKRDFVSPENYRLIATDPDLAVDVACWYWVKHGLNELADADNLREVTRRINGGFNGLPDREERLARARWFLVPETFRVAG